MALNFDGGTALDRVMLTISGTAMWLPLYALILWLVWRRSGWRGMSVFLVLMLLALGLSDIVSGIFKHNGLLGDMLPQFEPRPRPMFTPSLEGLEITPDSLRALRRAAMPHARRPGTGLRRPAGLPQAGTEPEQTIHPPRLKHICAEFINFARSIVQTFKNTRYEHRTQ